MNEAGSEKAPLLDEEFLARCAKLVLFSRTVIQGRVRGEKRSRRRGMSTEFADHKDYTPGDDLRHLDWNIFGRLEKLFIKLFEEEEERNVFLLLDASASMQIGEPNKWRHARQIAAALGAIALSSGDRVHLRVFDEKMRPFYPALRGARSVLRLIDTLEKLPPGKGTSLGRSLRAHAAACPPGSIQILISDLLDPQGLEDALRQVPGSRGDSWLVHLLAGSEIEPQLQGDLRLVDSELQQHVDVTLTRSVLNAYRRAVEEFRQDLRNHCQRFRIQPLEVSTAVPFDQVILEWMRQKRWLT